jgi:hypothetical protein
VDWYGSVYENIMHLCKVELTKPPCKCTYTCSLCECGQWRQAIHVVTVRMQGFVVQSAVECYPRKPIIHMWKVQNRWKCMNDFWLEAYVNFKPIFNQYFENDLPKLFLPWFIGHARSRAATKSYCHVICINTTRLPCWHYWSSFVAPPGVAQ